MKLVDTQLDLNTATSQNSEVEFAPGPWSWHSAQLNAAGISTAAITFEVSNTREIWHTVLTISAEGLVYLPVAGHRYARARVSTAEGSSLKGELTVIGGMR